jgi:hypothetical protein
MPASRKSHPPIAKRPAATATPEETPNSPDSMDSALAGSPERYTTAHSGWMTQKK